MYRKDPVYVTPKDSYLAQDKIIPYGGRVSISSESRKREAALRLLTDRSMERKKNSND